LHNKANGRRRESGLGEVYRLTMMKAKSC